MSLPLQFITPFSHTERLKLRPQKTNEREEEDQGLAAV